MDEVISLSSGSVDDELLDQWDSDDESELWHELFFRFDRLNKTVAAEPAEEYEAQAVYQEEVACANNQLDMLLCELVVSYKASLE